MPAGGKRPAAASPPAEQARDTSADSVVATEPEIGERPALFISYSRQDVAFVRELATALHRHGKDAWVDWEDIPPTADWRHKVEAGIEASKAFAFAISPDSIASDVCRQELVHAVGAGKRIIPVVVRPVDAHDVPEPLSGPNWIFFTDGSFDVSVETLVEALDTDLEWVDTHARILVRAVEWERHDRDRNYLLRGSDLREAETWLAEQEQHRERATALQVAYILAGRHAATRRSRQVLASVAVALVVTALLAIFAILQRNTAIANSHTARSRELATAAGAQLGVDPQLSVVLARRATEVSRTREAEDALRTALARSRQLLELRHGKWVRSAVYSRDGSRILTASDDGSAAIWNAVTGRQLHRLVGPGTSVARASFSPEGTRVVTAGDDGTVAIWDARNERRLHVLRGQRGIMHASFSPDGTRVLTCGNDRTARLWDAGTGDPLAVLRGHTTTVSTCRFSPDGRRIVTAGDDDDHVPRVWDARSATLVDVLHGHTGAIWDVRFSPDSRRIVTTSTDGSARVWEGSLPVLLAGHSGTVWAAAFAPSGGRVATGDTGGTTRVWDARTGGRLAVIRGGNDAVTGVGFSPDGRLLVTTNGDGTVRVWNSWTGEQLFDLRGHDGWASGGTFSRDGRRVLTAGEDGTARVWDVTHGLPQIVVNTGKNAVGDLEFSRSGDSVVASSTGGTLVVRLGRTPGVVRIPGGATAAAFNLDASRVVTVGPSGLADVWDSRSGRLLEKLKRGNAMLTDTAFARDGRTVLAVGLGGTAVVWHGGDQQRATALRGDSGDLKAGAFSPDGTRVVTAGPDGALWSASSGRRLAVLRHGDTVNAAAFSPDGRTIVTAGSDGTVRLWRADGTSLAVLRGPSRPVVAASFSGDSRHVISASSDGLPRVWDVATQRSVVLRGHKGVVPTAALSPDGRFAVTGGFDGSARIFDAESGQELERLRGPSREILKVAFSPDGRHVAVGGLDGALRIYACELCGSIDDLLALAAQVHRPLSVDEQVRFLHKRA